jgi:DNA topoisomerase-2
MTIKKIETTSSAVLKYMTASNVIRQTKYESNLRFGKIMLLTDFDQDGSHIFGLLTTMFKKFWPELFAIGAIYRFNTPLVKVEFDKKELFFYSLVDFNAWVSANKSKKFNSRYLKGLGSSTAKDFKKYFDEMDKNLVQVTINDPSDLAIVDLVFGKESGSSDRRKKWIDLEKSDTIAP